MMSERSFRRLTLIVLAYAVGMAYLESAVVVYLNGALGGRVGEIFPLKPALEAGDLIAIELGRELGTLVMIAAIGMLVGRSAIEQLAWSSVVFGAWDIGYYAWLYVFAGWPSSLATVDLLFLLPVPWAGPVWSPVVVSTALIGFGLLAAYRMRTGRAVSLVRWHVLAGLGGGFLVILSYTLDAANLIAGGLPGPYPWPIFLAGMALAAAAAVDVIRRSSALRPAAA
jgi:hypothetical protein